MPRKKWDEEDLRKKVLELRRQGKSYREIAKELGCSVFTVSKVLSPFENPQSRLKQVAELAMRVEDLSKKLDELARRLEEYRSRLEGLKPVEELRERLSRIDERLSEFDDSLYELIEKMEWIERSVSRRLRNDWNCCKHIDKEGYCTYWRWYSKVEDWDMKKGFEEGEVVYHLNVKKHPLICTACPSYKPRG
jgi:transposase